MIDGTAFRDRYGKARRKLDAKPWDYLLRAASAATSSSLLTILFRNGITHERF
jgi:hypothetical protein